ncbi:MAG: hypothetical protein PVF43_14880 [Candidatus Eiseniibacteriota bacterium]|jgi:hypothetical protein
MTKIARLAPRTLAGLLLLTLSVLAFAGTTDPWMHRLGPGRLEAANQAYLTASFNKAVAGFGVMSPLKAGLDIIEGSRVGASLGVTAQLEIGDLVQPAYDYVDIAWRTLLVGSATLLGIRYLLQATGLVDSLVLGFALLVAALVFFVRWLAPRWTQGRAVLRDVLSVSIVGVVAIYYLLPASVLGASYLSRIITAPAIEEAEQGFQQTREQLFPEEESAGGWGGRLKQLQERVERTADYLKVRAGDVVVWTVKLITGYVFDCIVFPLTLFLVLLWLTRSIMRYAFQRSFQRSFGEEMERVLAAREVR